MKLGALISGAKDSIYAAYMAGKKHDLTCLITIIPEKPDSWMFHVPNLHLVSRQAELIHLPLISVPTSGEKEKELLDLKQALRIAKEKYHIKAVVSGAIASNYQKTRIDKICKELELKSITPLWHMNPEQYMQKLILDKFEIIIAAVAADGMDESWLGRKIDKNCIEDLKKLNIHLCGEGGEYETFVLDCPLFSKKIKIIKAEKKMESECCGIYKIKNIELMKK